MFAQGALFLTANHVLISSQSQLCELVVLLRKFETMWSSLEWRDTQSAYLIMLKPCFSRLFIYRRLSLKIKITVSSHAYSLGSSNDPQNLV